MKKETKVKPQGEPVLVEDRISHYGIDAEAELIKIFNEELMKEIGKNLKKWVDKMPTVTGTIRKIKWEQN